MNYIDENSVCDLANEEITERLQLTQTNKESLDENTHVSTSDSIRKRENMPTMDELHLLYHIDSVSRPDTPISQPDLSLKLPFNRLVQRNMPHHQSNNIFALSRRSRINPNKSQDDMNVTILLRCFYRCLPRNWLVPYWPVFFYDWFHTFLRLHTYWAVFCWSVVWTVFVLVFALIYFGLNHSIIERPQCKFSSGFEFTFTSAFGFSLLTTTTVGYTLPGGTNSFFENCPAVQTAIYGQCILALFFNALLISIVYARISRAESRSSKLLFADKAIIRPMIVSRGDRDFSYRWTFEFRIFDLDASHPSVESHVRIYASTPHHEGLQVCRTLRPSDSLDGWVLTSVPYTIVHEIDVFSPLFPTSNKLSEYDTWFNGKNGLDRRASDARTLQTARWICPSCSMACPDLNSLITHIKYMKIKNKHSRMSDHSHLSISDDLLDIESVNLDTLNKVMLKKHLENVEIICVVEGIEPITSGTFQALQSYTLDEIVFNGSFEKCIHLKGDEFVVDLSAFHKISSLSHSADKDE